MIDLGPEVFEGGMAYVALSRAKQLNNVYLINFEPTVLYCNLNSIEEYNRLYNKFNLKSKIINEYNTLPTPNTTAKNNRKQKTDLVSLSEMIENNRLIYNKRRKNEPELNKSKAPIELTTKNNSFSKITTKKQNQIDLVTNSLVCTDINNDYHLTFNNEMNGCFANVSIQALICCDVLFTSENF